MHLNALFYHVKEMSLYNSNKQMLRHSLTIPSWVFCCLWKRFTLPNVKFSKPCFRTFPPNRARRWDTLWLMAAGMQSAQELKSGPDRLPPVPPHESLKPARLPGLLNKADHPPPTNSICRLLNVRQCSRLPAHGRYNWWTEWRISYSYWQYSR